MLIIYIKINFYLYYVENRTPICLMTLLTHDTYDTQGRFHKQLSKFGCLKIKSYLCRKINKDENSHPARQPRQRHH